MEQDLFRELTTILMGQSQFGDPLRYANLIRATRHGDVEYMRNLLPKLKFQLEQLERSSKQVSEFKKQVSGDGYARRRKDSKKIFESLDNQSDTLFAQPNIDVVSIISTHYDAVTELYTLMVQGTEMITSARMVTMDEGLNSWTAALNEKDAELGMKRIDALSNYAKKLTSDELNSLNMEQKLNQGAMTSFIQGLTLLERMSKTYEKYLAIQARNVESYFEKLQNRHKSGIRVCEFPLNGEVVKSATLTDATILVWDNLDKVGEIEGGADKNELSAYTLHRANSMIEAAKHDDVWVWLVDPAAQLIGWVKTIHPMVVSIHNFVIRMKTELGDSIWKLNSLDLKSIAREFEDVVDSLNLMQITEKTTERVVSKTEKFAIEHRNKSLQRVADLLAGASGLTEIVHEVLKLKIEERNFYVKENSFYVCTIGTGNQFTGEAPGALKVIPGEKPHVKLTNIWGDGFDEIRDFIGGMDEARKWSPLFLSTSPSGSTDKNNMLFVGPQGCGKSQAMRAIASRSDSIAIFATGSDFLTAWFGESQKNPKRLFEEAVKLHKTSGMPVFILIDEIDMVLNEDRSSSKINLSLEFQNLMDGIVAYPGITLIGATNNVERIPTPMLRRFAKVLLVGELSRQDSVKILRHYLETYLPCESFTEEQYGEWARLLEGATGDAIRKVIDEVWLTFMRGFISSHNDVAESILKFIHDSHGDNFDISMLTDEERAEIKERIKGTNQVVTSLLVDEQMVKLLNNFAVRKQIEVARNTYRKARQTLERHKAGEKGLGF
jgi:ATPase family associated with various cellular activities (AAA)